MADEMSGGRTIAQGQWDGFSHGQRPRRCRSRFSALASPAALEAPLAAELHGLFLEDDRLVAVSKTTPA